MPLQKVASLAVYQENFKEFIWNDRLHRAFLAISLLAVLLQFIVFKSLYPYASFIFGDSFNYLRAASSNIDINMYPIGYSKFLRIFNTFTKSDTALVFFQYLTIQLSSLWFTFTLFYFYRPGTLTKLVLLVITQLNPVFLYLSNYISSDALFYSISITWFTLLLWILHMPTRRLILWQAILLLLAFSIRYNALYYPFIASIALFLSPLRLKRKLAGVGISCLLIVLFIFYSSNEYYRLIGIRQFSAFSGWQIANNAMYAYRYIDGAHVCTAPPSLQPLDQMVRHYFDTSRDLRTHPYEMVLANTMYMWDARSPLQKYMRQQGTTDTTFIGKFKNWASMAPLYTHYGGYLIRQYPAVFLKYYLIPNAIKYYTPPLEFLGEYNMGRDTVARTAQDWFQYKSQNVRSAFRSHKISSLDFMPVAAAITNILFFLTAISLIALVYSSLSPIFRGLLVLTVILWLVNFGFSVFSSPITLRYQLFGFSVFSGFAFVWLDLIYEKAFLTDKIVI